MNSLSMLKRLKKLNSTYKTGFEDLLLDVQNNKAKIPFDVNRLLDMKKMLLGEVLLTEKLFCGLESALGKLLKFRIVHEISDDSDDSDVVMEEVDSDMVMIEHDSDTEMEDEQEIHQPNLDDYAVSKSVKKEVKDNLLKVPKSNNIKRIGQYSSMIQKEQFLEHSEEVQSPISEPELENEEPTIINKPSPAYVLKMTKLRPASSYAKPSNTEPRKIVTVPYKPTVKLPCKVLKPVKKLNMIANVKVSQKSFNPRDDAIAIKHIKEKIYQRSYLKTNENEPIASIPIEKVYVPSIAEKPIVENQIEEDPILELPILKAPPKKKPKARRNTIAERPAKVVEPKVKKVKSPKKIVEPKVPKRKVIQRRNSVAARPVAQENLDSTEEFLVYDIIKRKRKPVPIVEIPKDIYDALDPEGLMDHITTVPFSKNKRGRGRPRKPQFIPTAYIKKESF